MNVVWLSLIWVLFLCCVLLNAEFEDCVVSPGELSALYDLYNSTDGVNWSWKEYGAVWNFSEAVINPCYPLWQGIECKNVTYYYQSEVYNCGVISLYLPFFGLVGVIPSQLSNLTRLKRLSLGYNALDGSIPESIGSLEYLEELSLNNNELDGTIPSSIGKLTRLRRMYIQYNSFYGTISNSIGSLKELMQLYMDNNAFVGSIPDCIGNLNYLVELYLNDNYLDGTIPSSIGNLSFLVQLYLSNNALDGTIPVSFGRLNYLLLLSLGNNVLDGTIPESIGNCTDLVMFDINNNAIYGSIPHYEFSSLVSFDASYNFISGKIPDSVAKWNELEYFILNYNLLSGSIPASLFALDLLYEVELSNNVLSGLIPSIGRNITYLYLQYNILSGSLTSSLSNGGVLALAFLDMSNNYLSGQLPVGLLNSSPSLVSFSASVNCLTGSIPTEICQLDSLVYLGLDGIATAKKCRTPIFKNIKSISTFISSNAIVGGIDVCLFNMPTLQTLQLSGNSIEWSFPSTLAISSSLDVMVLSHNRITGTIPHEIQRKAWLTLDLSFNKLVGTVDTHINVTSNTSLVLQVNRLSGKIPSSVVDLQSVNILTGNVFTCDLKRSSLPGNDPSYKVYQCGSNSFNESVVAWFISAFCWVGSLIFIKQSRLAAYGVAIKLYLEEFDAKGKFQLSSLSKFMRRTFTCLMFLTVLLIVVFVPMYVLLTQYYKTIVNQYAWIVSAAFLSGVTPAMTLLTSYMLLILLLYVIWLGLRKTVSDKSSSESLNLLYVFKLCCVVLINCLIMGVVNVGYVQVILHNNTNISTVTQVTIALFKLLWNDYCIKAMVVLVRSKSDIDEELNMSTLTYTARKMPYLTFMVLFNLIIAPCFATAVVDSNCFYTAFVSPESVSSQFPVVTNTDCAGAYNCVGNATSEEYIRVSYDPPFIYSYQCTSSILTNFATVYIYMFLILAFLKPAMIVTLLYIRTNFSEQTYLYKATNLITSRLLKSPVLGVKIFQRDRFILRTLSKIAVFLTFGVVFPPIACVVCVAFLVEVHVNIVLIGRLLFNAKEKEFFLQLKEQLCRECEHSMMLLVNPLVTLVVPFAAFFYAFFVFDIYGDKVGFRKAIWAPTLLVAWPGIIWCIHSLNFKWNEKRMTEKESEIQSVHNIL